MCELLGYSASAPTRVRVALDEFARQGGETAPNRDGWGVALYQGRDAHIAREAHPAADSAHMRFLREHELASPLGIAHVRHATQGADTLSNTQPFSARLDGRLHVFAHNGVIRDSASLGPFMPPWQPLGETDSECTFALLMQRLAELPDKRRNDWRVRFEVFAKLCVELRSRGIFNVLFSDGEYLYVHAHKRHWHHGDNPTAPGLWHLHRQAHTASSPSLAGLDVQAGASLKIHLLASVPLSDENWQPLQEGALRVFRGGELLIAK
ncbi:MAG: class II glutamine amidotransferase [Gammaproteobacteria bacterium]|nr:class II glutamine amidotransferase [Gammaproteobacteria bacterium]MDE1984717.1 class II glutamine amidotransferase [Gammaproteobacteria bacterium]MDE2109231.1 class II glutamine amidotransferase [Gammaproteobacteria bacterium]MDE2459876.1 class II glutamine amidotransferase [Gammaproteobacteria bacterium]